MTQRRFYIFDVQVSETDERPKNHNPSILEFEIRLRHVSIILVRQRPTIMRTHTSPYYSKNNIKLPRFSLNSSDVRPEQIISNILFSIGIEIQPQHPEIQNILVVAQNHYSTEPILIDISDVVLSNLGTIETEISFVPTTEESVEALEKGKVGSLELRSNNDEFYCSICQEQLIEDDLDMEVIRLPCFHIYHQYCIGRWLRTSNTCPFCRYSLLSDD